MHSRHSTLLAFGLAFVVQIITTAIWYVFLPHQVPLLGYLPYIGYSLCGFLVGLLDNHDYLRKTLVLGALLSVTAASMNWIAGQLGVPVDFGTASGAAMAAILALPICIPLSMGGGILGSLVYRLLIQRKRSSSKR